MKKTVPFCLTLCLFLAKVVHAEVCMECNDCDTFEGKIVSICNGELCYAKLEKGKVNRGCATKDICDGNTLCKTCVGATCNNKDFERPSCATDDGGEKKCEGLCYIYVNGTETKKGCLVDLPEADSIRKECENATSGSCLKCNSNLCNKNDPLKCVKCNENDDTCTSNTAAELAAKVAVCKINEDRCYVSHDINNRNARGCTVKESCDSTNREKMCCEKSGCNVQKLPELRNECFKDAGKTKTKVCMNPKDDCYSKIEKGVITRGCKSDQGNDCNANSDSCKICHGNKCNKQITCKTCNELIAKNCTSAMCDNDKCISQIKGGKMEHRCAAKEEKCAGEDECATCDTADCNSNFAPTTWLKCHKCEGSQCLSQRNPDQATYCEKYTKDDKCYTQVSHNTVSRGCLSDLANPQHCNLNRTFSDLREAAFAMDGSEVCVTCVGNACNSAALKLQPLLCYQCDAKVPGCGPELNSTLQAEKCVNPMPDGSNDRCYSHKTEIKRGCLSDVAKDEKCMKGDTCHVCDKNGCNNQRSGQETRKPFIALYLVPVLVTMFLFK